MLRYQSRLPAQNVPAFVSLDARLAWSAGRQLELAVVGQNLLADHHVEFGGNSASRTEVRRGVYGQVTYRR
jgi:iron complex outermembrane recepter protein